MLSESFVHIITESKSSKDKFAQFPGKGTCSRISINDINGHLYNEKNMGKIPLAQLCTHVE